MLVDDAAQLQQKYPGSNTEHIEEQQTLVVNNWNTLQEKAIQRRNDLQEAQKFQKFMADVSDFFLMHRNFSFAITIFFLNVDYHFN